MSDGTPQGTPEESAPAEPIVEAPAQPASEETAAEAPEETADEGDVVPPADQVNEDTDGVDDSAESEAAGD